MNNPKTSLRSLAAYSRLIALTALVLLSGTTRVQAQTATIDGGSTSGNGPMGSAAYHAGEYIYLASEIGQDFTINRINFKNAVMAGSGTIDAFGSVNIYLKYTSAQTLATGTYPGTATYTQVYSGPIVWGKSGWSGAYLQTPFAYSQASGNLQVLIVRLDNAGHAGHSSYCANGNAVLGASALTCRRYNGAGGPTVGVSNMTASNFRGAIQFVNDPNCSSAPAPGNTVFILGSGCSGTQFSMGLQNATLGSNVTYQWQSADDAAFSVNVVNLGTNSVQWASQTTGKYYRCLVTCAANPPAVASTPLFVPVRPAHMCALCAAGVSATDHFFFEKISNVAYGTGNSVNNNSASAIGTYQNFRGLSGDVLVNNSFDVTVNVSGGTPTDQILIWCDWDQNGTFNNDPTELMYTSPTGAGPFTATILVPAGASLGSTTMRIRLHDTGFGPLANPCGNASYGEVEDYSLNVLPPPACGLPSGLASALVSATTANISWLAAPNATAYNVEVRSTGTPGTPGATFAGSTGGLSILATGLTFGETYSVYVQADCSGDLSNWVGPISHLQDYCATTAVVGANDPVINLFTYGGISNVNASNAGYLDFTTQTAFVQPGAATAFTLDRNTNFTNDSILIWVDLNNDIDFDDPGELVYASTTNPPADPLNDFITIPNGTSSGNKRMRVRRVNMSPGFGWTSPCGTAPFGQTHDYTVNVCAPVVAAATVVDNCGSNVFTVDVDITALGSGTSATINYSVNGTAQPGVAAGLGITTLGGAGFNAGDEVTISVSNGTPCIVELGDYFSNCPVSITCGNTITVNHCYTNNDPRTWTFNSSVPSETVTLTFISGTMAPNDVLRVYNGVDNTGTILLTGNFANLVGVTATSTGPSIFIEIDSDASGSCSTGGATSWQFEVECTAGCTDPDGAVSVSTNCANNNFTIDVEVIGTGDAATTDLEYTVNGGAPVVIPGLVASDIESIGPFNINDNVVLRLLHGSDPLCNKTLGTFTDDDSCVPGELCISAIPLGVNPTGLCPSAGTPGSNATATADGGIFSCSASTGPFLDKWYRFNSGANSAIAYTFSSFTFTSLLVEVFQGGCNGPSVHCASGASAVSNSFVVTPNTDYWLRMASAAGQGGTFSICVSAGVPPPDPCSSIANISACAVSTGAVAAPAGTGAWSNNTLGGPYQTPGIERIFTFTPTISGVHTINVTQYTGGNFIDFYWKQVGTCSNAGWNYLSDVNALGNVATDVGNGGVPLNFVAGNTYYIMWDPENTTGRTVAFEVICPIPAPANDDCANAIVLTPGSSCAPLAGTTLGAAQSAAPSICTGFTSSAANDVWYSFVATRTSHRVTVAGQGAFDPIIDLRSGACNGTTVACVDATIDGGTEVLTAPGLTIGQTYLVRVYGWAGGTGAFTICVEEPDCAGVFGGTAIPGSACNDGNANTVLDVYDSDCNCSGVVCTTDLVLDFDTDSNSPTQNTWELRAQGSGILVQSGSGLPGSVNNLSLNTCLPNGCYYLRVLDSGGDGIANGGYILRTSGANGQRIIDNRDNFSTGSLSAVIGNGGFCLPLGTDKLIYTSCDKLDWVNNQFIVASENAAVSAQFGVGNQADDGYQFWWFDPNGTYGYTKFRSHATSDGFGPASATRACHAQINNWSPNQIPAFVLMNVKVRSRVNGANSEWGPVCRFKIDPARAACPLTKLMDIPGNQFFSCGVTRAWGSSAASRVVARTVDGATQYQFRWNNSELAAPVIRTTTTPVLQLNWNPALPNGTYQVQVRAFKNGVWCVTSLPWGDECNVTITGSPATQTMALPGTGSTSTAELAMFPNPNNGDQLTLSLSAVEEGVNTVSVDIFDLNGARVVAKVVPVNDGMIYQQMALDELASGLYMVNITAGSKRYTERLVITK